MEQPPEIESAEHIECPVCEQHTFELMVGESGKCPCCGHFTTFGDPPDEEDE